MCTNVYSLHFVEHIISKLPQLLTCIYWFFHTEPKQRWYISMCWIQWNLKDKNIEPSSCSQFFRVTMSQHPSSIIGEKKKLHPKHKETSCWSKNGKIGTEPCSQRTKTWRKEKRFILIYNTWEFWRTTLNLQHIYFTYKYENKEETIYGGTSISGQDFSL